MNDFRYAARLACYRHVVVIGVRSVAGIIMLAMQRYRLSSHSHTQGWLCWFYIITITLL